MSFHGIQFLFEVLLDEYLSLIVDFDVIFLHWKLDMVILYGRFEELLVLVLIVVVLIEHVRESCLELIRFASNIIVLISTNIASLVYYII